MIELTLNQKAKIAISKINRALYRMNAARGMDGANFERLKYDADDFSAVSAAVKSIGKASAELSLILDEIKGKAAEIEAAREMGLGKKQERGARRKGRLAAANNDK